MSEQPQASVSISEETFDTTHFPRIIVSLTSYPKRIGTVHQVIETLLRQTMLPDAIVLWLADSQFPNREKGLPEQLMALVFPCSRSVGRRI